MSALRWYGTIERQIANLFNFSTMKHDACIQEPRVWCCQRPQVMMRFRGPGLAADGRIGFAGKRKQIARQSYAQDILRRC
jgi:hypothetical protein